MKNGDSVEYYRAIIRYWQKAYYVGTAANGTHVIDCPINGLVTRPSNEVRVPKKKVTHWVNLYREGNDSVTGGRLHKTEEDAIAYVKSTMPSLYIKTVPVTWEE